MSAPIVIVSGCDGDTRRYRAWHAAESLAMAGRRVTVRTVDSDPPSPADLEGAAALILHRVAWRPDVARWIAAVRAGGGRVLYDTDDRVFDDAFAARAAALGTQAPPADYRRAREACDGCIAAPAPLAEAVAALGRPAAVVRNAIDLELWRLSEAAWRRRRGGGERPRDGIVIGYASGTATHDADFRVCAPAVMALLEARPDVRLRVIGPLALGGAWDRFGPRVERVPFMPWRRLPEALAAFDINVAPLDLADPFCLAKSELKWFEAGAVGVPTIAAVTPAFRAAIRDGLDGFVAADVDGWRAALAALVADAPRRRAVGAAAREAIRDDYLSDRRAVEWAAALDALGAGGAGGHGAGRAAGPTSRPPAADHDVAAARPLILADDPTLERFAMGAEAVLAEHGVAAAASVGAVGPWLAARAAAIRTAAGRHDDPAAPAVAALPYPIDHRVFAPARTDDPAGRPPLLFDWALGRDSSRALALQALHAAADRVPRLAVRLFSSDAAAPPPDPAAIDRPGWRDLGPLDAAARAALFAGGGVLVAPCFGNVPRAVVEAMAAGVAVAAVDVPSVRWLLRDGATAALAAPDGDAPGVAAARLLAEPARRERAVAAGRDAVARHSIGRHAAAADALARGGAVGPPPWTWQLDQLQPFGPTQDLR
ncbi:MAG: glycosyltransferase [Anaerolineae bacterium]